ncbi:hypothetical protein M0813_29802 [Anaeramoeba flamelloides]|uniref:Stealth protein CR2 conserved region 2 domain-containing protein n=1 Tax=Anaeramoeba flamelloides TaxID=1746091 RepID=A0ABQ8XLJ8_9EUKA|nr:hypothetical protein M0813_29802 [Anaeramoeba flamelloides]
MITCTKYQKSIIVLASFVILVIVSSNGGWSKKQGTNPKDIVTDEGKIDVVFTWAGIKKTMSSRNWYNYELQFSLRSVHKYMAWVNKIYILINPDKDYPYWIKEEYSCKVIVYDRCQLINNPDHCPTNNNFAVVAGLHQIAGLTNKFILFDDDMFINQPLTPDYFFTENDLPRVFQFSRRMQINYLS